MWCLLIFRGTTNGRRYLDDGKLTVFRRAGIYDARLRLPASTKYIIRSLKTSNEQSAIDLGRRLLFQLEQRVEAGLPPKSKNFAAVIDDYIPSLSTDRRSAPDFSQILAYHQDHFIASPSEIEDELM